MKFTVVAIVSVLIAPLAYAAALSPANINALAARDTNAQSGFEDVVGYALPDGTRKIDFYLNGALEGSAVETKDGVEFLDASGAVVSLGDLDQAGGLAKRVSKFDFAIKFAKLLAKYGKRAWDFFYCVGLNAAWKCSDDFIDCAGSGIPPWSCIEGISMWRRRSKFRILIKEGYSITISTANICPENGENIAIVDLFLAGDKIATSEFDLFQLALRWCQRNGNDVLEYSHILGLSALTDEQQVWPGK
ncbi:uncharacterized protein CC84DRAFT_1201993 [Paraphaeosphaeria sporulosa]|uniref:Uncharacterized protein n=1 Tax=Paraphaeosphaeria sporulosa TaxID=1460663 RepID=A0A177CNQ9_9PLEO|nr:uncharacterized protein CC84DRAFT_1201993 [Paraphaeosphaeria sporulosa]OAG09175.1 hypothetical protein CC84DRAFT_1201993 [Paraphaeosphaeria sporulosa]